MLGSCVLPSEMREIPVNCSGVFSNSVVPLRVWVYLHSDFCGGLRKTHLFYTRAHIGRSRSSKVDDFDTNRKRICDFLLVIHSNRNPILHRFWDTKLQMFPTHSHLASRLRIFSFEVSGEVYHAETRVTGLSSSKDCMIVAWVILTPYHLKRTDRRTDLL